jgi:hypothetical protein
MLADRASPALFAPALLTAMRADPAPAALFTLVPHTPMRTDAAPPALLALVLLTVVVAADVPVAVPPLCAAALGVAAAAAAIAVGTSASTAPAVEDATEMPRQTVDQILLVPGLRQLISGAQLLQLGDGLRARGEWGSRNIDQNAAKLGQYMC